MTLARFQQIEQITLKLLEDYEFFLERGWVSAELILEDMEFIITPLPGISRRTKEAGLDTDAITLLEEKEIVLDESLNGNPRYNFTVAHELGHIILHSQEYADCNSIDDFLVAFEAFQSSKKEEEANTFASLLLLPHKMIYPRIKEYVSNLQTDVVEAMKQDVDSAIEYMATYFCKQFHVSSSALKWRLKEYKYQAVRNFIQNL